MTLDTVFCTQCGARNPANARFCDQCGAALVKPGAAPQAPAQPQAALPVSAFTCPQCGVPALPGEAFCDNCGAALAAPSLPQGAQPSYPPPQPVTTGPSPAATQPNAIPPTPSTPVAPPVIAPPQPAGPARTALAPARLKVEGSGALVALPASAEAIVGRADPASGFYPDVDLTAYGALEHGVGRRHLRLALDGGRLVVEDLDSTNGTALNGQRLAPRQRYPLNPDDLLTVGRLGLRLVG